MERLCEKQCIIGEGPLWNEKEQSLYFVNGMGKEICIYRFNTKELIVRPMEKGVPSLAFSKDGRLIVSTHEAIYYLGEDDSLNPLYDMDKYRIDYANDGKVGPDGRFYVGTQSGKYKGVSEAVDGKLYSIDSKGNVRVLLDNMLLSNGLDWSVDETKFYCTDSPTGIIREYDFDKETGDISFTGREVSVPGVDGFTVGMDNQLYVAAWSQMKIVTVDAETFTVSGEIELPGLYPASCGFAGKEMDQLVVVTATYAADLEEYPNTGYPYVQKLAVKGRKPYLFG